MRASPESRRIRINKKFVARYKKPVITTEPNPVMKARIKALINRWIQASIVIRDFNARIRAPQFEKFIFPSHGMSKPQELIEIVQIAMRELGFPHTMDARYRYYVGLRLNLPEND